MHCSQLLAAGKASSVLKASKSLSSKPLQGLPIGMVPYHTGGVLSLKFKADDSEVQSVTTVAALLHVKENRQMQ